MSRLASVILVACIALFLCEDVCAGRLVLRADSLFVGECRNRSLHHRIELSLLDGQYFVLRQIFTGMGRSFTRDMTGHWRQREGGAVLTLENAYGFYATLAVGIDNLYGSFSSVSRDSSDFATLSPASFRQPVFTLMGTLFSSGKNGRYDSLRDGACDRLFSVTGSELARLPKADALFVDAEMAFGPKESRILRIRSHSFTIPPSNFQKKDIPFAEFACGKMWRFPAGSGSASCAFFETEPGRGTFEMTGQSFWLSVKYTRQGEHLAFELGKKEREMLRKAEALDLLAVLEKTTSWGRDAGGLLLFAGSDELVFMEDLDSLKKSQMDSGRHRIR